MNEFEKALASLNYDQRMAVEQTEGPVLVIAGPGTGKTQLLGTRVGYILQKADVEPQEILCLTYTDAGVLALRQRLEKLVPAAAHKVRIYTYHGFGTELIRNNLEYFSDLQGEPIDDLAIATIINAVIDKLPYGNPIRSSLYGRAEMTGFISDAKQALLKPKDIESIASHNLATIKNLASLWHEELKNLSSFKAINKAAAPIFESMLAGLKLFKDPAGKLPAQIRPLKEYVFESLAGALEEFAQTGKTPPLTAWKNTWLEKDLNGQFIPAGAKAAMALSSAAGVYEKYQATLDADKLFDYDDMILKAIAALEANTDFKYTLAEHYSYIMLDEFQDTNRAQMRLVNLLTDHPVHEGRPNVLAVGDDDQAIYAFQGADHANMAAFAQTYRDTKLINLSQNYRSPQDLVDLAAAVSIQIKQRLHHSFPGLEKILVAASQTNNPAIAAREFISDAAQYAWVANEIKKLTASGMAASQIAVLAPRHKYLESLVPFLARLKIPISYEKRENILDDPKIIMLERTMRLVLALAENNQPLADHLWPEVASYDFWGVPTEKIWQINEQSRQASQSWTSALLEDSSTKTMATFILRLKDLARLASLEEQLDALIGIGLVHEKLKLPYKSPFYEHYFGTQAIRREPAAFTDLLSSLSLLRTRLRNRQRRQASTTYLADFIAYVDDIRAANINILNTSPYHESKEAVNLLTAYGAKGREFQAVFVLACQNEVWGNGSRARSRSVKLPANLEYISYAGMSEDERLRLFYVAVTRAKQHLYLTSYSQTLAGRYFKHLEFLGISRGADDSLTSSVLPPKYQTITQDTDAHLTPETTLSYWGDRHLPPHRAALSSLVEAKLQNHKLSATHLNHFLDVERAGPQTFFIYDLLGFPQAPSSTSAFGSAVHASLAWAGAQISQDKKPPTKAQLLDYFDRQLEGGWLREDDRQELLARGHLALPVWLAQIGNQLTPGDKFEKSFGGESVMLGNTRLTGKIDRLIINNKSRQIRLVDIKTGKAFRAWDSSTKAHKFKQQLMFYKLLVENSSSFKGYQVTSGEIEFAEPLDGQIISVNLSYNDEELDQFKRLITAVWQRIQALDLPDIAKYPKTLRGIKEFEADLLGLKKDAP